jgi:galactoside O-acetyltransferase
MITNSFYTEEELANLGLKSYGKNVKISRFARIYSPNKITIGDNVRIDDFCILSGKIEFGSYIHIAAACLLFGGNDGIVMENFTGISSRSAVYAESDDYSGICFTNPMLPMDYRRIIGGGVLIKKHAIIGTGCSIMPGVVIGEGCAIGSMSLVNKSQNDWGICLGIPCKKIKERDKKLLDLEKNFLLRF